MRASCQDPTGFRIFPNVSLAGARPARPLLSAGTMSRHTTSRRHGALTDSWEACGEGSGFTFPADSAVRRIDYLYARGLRCSAAEVPDTDASDHRPLVATFAMTTP